MGRVIAIVNQKGGVGKTTTAVNVSAAMARQGHRVLLVDVDPQGNATSGLGINAADLPYSLYEAISEGPIGIADVRQATKVDRLHLVPARPDLAGANVELVGAAQREFKLHQALQPILDDYDFIFIDNPPSLGLLTVNGLVAAHDVLIPVQCEYYALEGLGQLLRTVELVRSNLKPDLNILGAVMTMYDGRNKLSEAVFNELYRYFPNRIFRTVIPRTVRLAEAPSHGQDIAEYEPEGKAARAYDKLGQEVVAAYRGW
jgi:chromosome partitioning protein